MQFISKILEKNYSQRKIQNKRTPISIVNVCYISWLSSIFEDYPMFGEVQHPQSRNQRSHFVSFSDT